MKHTYKVIIRRNEDILWVGWEEFWLLANIMWRMPYVKKCVAIMGQFKLAFVIDLHFLTYNVFFFCVTRIGKTWKRVLGCCTSLWCCNWKHWTGKCGRVEIPRYYQFSFAWCCLQEDRQFGWKKRTWLNIGIDDHQSLVSCEGVGPDERWGNLMVTLISLCAIFLF